MSLGARELMKDQSGLVLWFRQVRGEEMEGKTGHLYEVEGYCKRETSSKREKAKENWKKPRKKCADCNLNENRK